MFIDFNILKIIQRASSISDLDAMQLFQEYTGLVMETISVASMDYFIQKDNVKITSPKDMLKFMDGLPEKIQNEPELLKQLQDEIFEIDMGIVNQFNKTASKGDKAYMEIYLLSKIKEYDNKLALLKKEANQIDTEESTS